MAGANRHAVTEAADALDAQLSRDPDDQGTELSEGLRGLVITPLTVVSAVIGDDRIVEVYRVRLV
jgi:hypothetical protein